MNIHDRIQQLVDLSVSESLIEREDSVYTRNQVLALMGLEEFTPEGKNEDTDLTIPDVLEELINYAVDEGLIEDMLDEKEQFQAKVMDVFLPRPSDVNKEFYKRYEHDPVEATDYFYHLSKKSNYIQEKRVKKNINYTAQTEYGDLDITINLSKPEKDPKQIAKERTMKKTNAAYPKCLLCVENEGYAGRVGHPARSNHRLVRVNLTDQNWLLQYSPYVYYNEHSIVLSEEHVPMEINRETFDQVLEFTEKFPHYFIGSNADLPIVGGSILSHNHYQAGHYEFPMARAEEVSRFELGSFPGITGSVVKWPMSVLRLRSESRKELGQAAEKVLAHWREYSDPEVEIYAYTEDEPHNTITPIARRRGNEYELDLVLRNNRTNDDHPMGIFHPHKEVHHIKKENIGLIEVMGLAVLPARLKDELKEVEKYILGEPNAIADAHIPWADELKTTYAHVAKEDVEDMVREAVGKKFEQALKHAGVFKRDEQGQEAFKRFINTLQ
ncbi:galactose-1-phosphate uridylyltransferase [Pontibacillus chungwhensis BH030062]|uniref:Galactose-1-phosphate uridylyltransferase n=1 Tax=Pontibacillus chungwhensis BH030062 TaxID=1385513 RepID=A0A0A2UTZ8_9BACI|nr:UDP-glucose--hexose-1-phosphate uridylyltransferase [Pontibacillus chungwhensis]KGP90238.1 galactose-1-phosphate uridylyltransferase [Pontibacillus chungwhensis BH030062]